MHQISLHQMPFPPNPILFQAEQDQRQPTNDSNQLPAIERLDPCKVLNTFGSKKVKTLLPPDFTPSEYTVLVGRTRECQEHIGNKRLRAIVNDHLQQYNSAPDKLEKTAIVTEVYNQVRAATRIGHFVKFEKGRYYEVGERTARERIGAMFRDSLHQKYRSSAKNKEAARKEKAKKSKKEGGSSNTFEDHSKEFEDFSNIFY